MAYFATQTPSRGLTGLARSPYIGGTAALPHLENFRVKGLIDDVRIYDHALSECEIRELADDPCNQPPVANSGADQTIEWDAGGTQVTLDGSSSFDPNGDDLTYAWSGDLGTASGPTPTFSISDLGTYVVTLVVNDGELLSEPDPVVITVVDTTAPTVAAELVPIKLKKSKGNFRVEYDCNDTCDTNPTITSAVLRVNGIEIPVANGQLG